MVKKVLKDYQITNKILSRNELIHSIIDRLSSMSILCTEDTIFVTGIKPSKDTLTIECTNGESITLEVKY